MQYACTYYTSLSPGTSPGNTAGGIVYTHTRTHIRTYYMCIIAVYDSRPCGRLVEKGPPRDISTERTQTGLSECDHYTPDYGVLSVEIA